MNQKVHRTVNQIVNRDLFAREAIGQLPKIITLLDRNPHSPTYGCFDRNFWHYKIIDFPSGMAQEFVWPLALAYHTPLPNNPYYQKPAIRQWVEAGILYAAHSAHPDGSCDDYFPFERAAGAAAFSLLACIESYQALELNHYEVLKFFEHRADWLAHHQESGKLANHQALIVLCLELAGKLLQTSKWESAKIRRLEQLLSWQNSEGWFQEYEGCDPGYQTLTISSLARLYQLWPDPQLKDPLIKAVNFTTHFVHPDGSYGGEYTSRNTYNFFPHGFELVGQWMPEALAINDQFLIGLEQNLNSCYADDHIIGHHTWNYLLAWRDFVTERPELEAELTVRSTDRIWFEGAKILIDRRLVKKVSDSAATVTKVESEKSEKLENPKSPNLLENQLNPDRPLQESRNVSDLKPTVEEIRESPLPDIETSKNPDKQTSSNSPENSPLSAPKPSTETKPEASQSQSANPEASSGTQKKNSENLSQDLSDSKPEKPGDGSESTSKAVEKNQPHTEPDNKIVESAESANPKNSSEISIPPLAEEEGLAEDKPAKNSQKPETTELYLAINKGGVFKLFRDRQLVASDTQFSVQVLQGNKVKNAVAHLVDTYEYEIGDDEILIQGQLGWAKQKQMTPVNLLILRGVMLTVGRFFPNLIRKILQKMLITGKKPAPFKFVRRLQWVDDKLQVTDSLSAESWDKVLSVGIGCDQTSIYVVMSRTFQPGQLQSWLDLTAEVKKLSAGETLTIERTL